MQLCFKTWEKTWVQVSPDRNMEYINMEKPRQYVYLHNITFLQQCKQRGVNSLYHFKGQCCHLKVTQNVKCFESLLWNLLVASWNKSELHFKNNCSSKDFKWLQGLVRTEEAMVILQHWLNAVHTEIGQLQKCPGSPSVPKSSWATSVMPYKHTS